MTCKGRTRLSADLITQTLMWMGMLVSVDLWGEGWGMKLGRGLEGVRASVTVAAERNSVG